VKPRLLWIGYGDIAQRTAPLLVKQGWQVVGVCRQPERKTAPAGVELVAASANNETELKALFDEPVAAVVITLTPNDYSRDGYHQAYVVPCRHLQQVFNQLAEPPRVLYVSSTGVYGQTHGEWVDEESATEPTSDSGEMLLQAERVIQGSAATVSVLRCSGIYGPGRERLRQQIQAGTAVISPTWTNRIHSDDVAGFIVHLLAHPEHCEDVYLVTDSQPLLQQDAYPRIAAQLGITITELPRSDKVGARGSKRLSNQRLLATGYQLLHPELASTSER